MLSFFLILGILNEGTKIYLPYIAENNARTSQVDQFAVLPARPRLGTWLIVTSWVEGTKFFILPCKLCLTRLLGNRSSLITVDN